MRLSLLLALVALPAFAANTDDGQRVFNDGCSRCHTAIQPPRPGEKAKPRPVRPRAADLVELQAHKSLSQFETWLNTPRKHVACRSGDLNPKEVAAVMSWLASIRMPEPLPLKERQQADLKASIESQKLQKQRQGTQPLPGRETTIKGN